MSDEPSGTALLDAARRALLDEVVPALSGRPRYVVLMVANAMGIAGRDLEYGTADRPDERIGSSRSGEAVDAASVSNAIRNGERDADAPTYAALERATERAVKIWRNAT